MTASKPPSVDISSLPDWIQKVLTRAPKAEPKEPSVLDLRGTPAWSLVADAALVSSFLPQNLGTYEQADLARETAEGDLLDYCVVSHEPRGARWTLTAAARTQVLKAIVDTPELAAAVERTSASFRDGVSDALRRIVRREPIPDLETLDLAVLESLRTAASLVADLDELKPPKLQDLDRAIDLRRLLGQFERMTGKSSKPMAKGATRSDRFFGREDDLKRLRSFVDVAKSQSFFETIQRAYQRLPFIARTPVAVWGLGGVGKTTLMAKFMLEHAHAAAKETRYPFAYIDFDRSAMSPRNRAGLLIEMTLQVRAQFPELADQMLSIRLSARELARRMDTSSNADSISRISPLMWDFRNAVDQLLDNLESRFSRPRPFLLVFDTFEVVQYTPSDVTALEELVRGFTLPNERGVWPRLRLVLSGRKEIRRFLGKVETIELRGIDAKGAEEMLLSLGADDDLGLEERDVKRLVAAIAQIAGGSDQGWRPLRLRLIAQVLKQMHADDPKATCSALVDQLITMLNDPQLGGTSFIDGILVRRILEHLRDGRVIALADPGLVVRRVTPDVIRHVMARGTPKPDLSQPISTIASSNRDDSVSFSPWELTEAEARDVFEAFKREVSLVEVDNEELWHRQDVRREMLPLLMTRRNRFRLLHTLAWEHYTNRLAKQANDRVAAAEAIYHGLWLDKPATELDALWPADSSFNPKIDSEEFPLGNRSPLFLKLQTGGTLTPAEASQLSGEVALRWLRRRGPALIEEGLGENVSVIRRTLRTHPRAFIDDRTFAGNAAEALYKGGYWADALSLAMTAAFSTDDFPMRYPDGDPAVSRVVRVASRIAGKMGSPLEDLESRVAGMETRDAAATIDVNLHIGLASRRLRGGDRGERLLAVCRNRLRDVSDAAWRSDVRLLRLAVLICDSDLLAHLQSIYVDATDGLPRDPELEDLARRAERIDPELAEEIGEYLSDRRPTFDLNFRESIMRGVRANREAAEALRYVVAFDHRDWKHPLTLALERALMRDSSGAITSVLLDPTLRLSTRVSIDKRAEPAQARSIIDALLDSGGLLGFARSLRKVDGHADADEMPIQADRWRDYPQDLFALAAALLRWHDALVRTVAERARTA